MPTNIKLLFTHLNSKCQNDSRNKNKMKRSHCHCCYSQGRREWPRAATDVCKDTSPPIVKISRFTHNYSTELRYHRVYSSVLRYHAQWKQDSIPVDIVPPACHTCFGGHHWMSGGGRGLSKPTFLGIPTPVDTCTPGIPTPTPKGLGARDTYPPPKGTWYQRYLPPRGPGTRDIYPSWKGPGTRDTIPL